MNEIVVIPNFRKSATLEGAKAVYDKIRTLGENVIVAESHTENLSDVIKNAKLLIVLGGDGTVISIADIASKYSVPVLGINFGTIGYLMALDFNEINRIDEVLSGAFPLQKRMMLDVSIERNGETLNLKRPCLNDVVLSNGPVPKILEFDLYVDAVFADNMRSDGLIVATPTGSSAYSMSAGGPAVSPSLDAIVTTPICPQRLETRPFVIGGDSVLNLKNAHCRGENSIYLTIDGRETVELYDGDIVSIKKSQNYLSLYCNNDFSFVKVLYTKLKKN